MLEFGSDFHLVDWPSARENDLAGLGDYLLLADGRQAIELLCKANGWQRAWIPEYFCYEIIDSIKRAGIEVVTYSDYPLAADYDEMFLNLPFNTGDVLLRMNFFGFRGWRDNSNIPVPVIEDHSHSPFGTWAKNSNADWCIASLRKSLPIAEGGILWSPKGIEMPTAPELTSENKRLAEIRWSAMRKKAEYLLLSNASLKESFRTKFIETEESFDNLSPSLIDDMSRRVLENFDTKLWFDRKAENWSVLSSIETSHFKVLNGECEGEQFSYTILCDSSGTRNRLRKALIGRCVYPAILWTVPQSASAEVRDFSECMLSIHCDARYSKEDIEELKSIIVASLGDA